jgi:hypothetical protein
MVGYTSLNRMRGHRGTVGWWDMPAEIELG